MLVIPAIDIKGGKCVRLEQGLMNQETVFSEDPLKTAFQWEAKGAKKIHLVDLDGAVQGAPVNKDLIKRIAEKLAIPVELGGGIRSMDHMQEYFDMGVADIIMGSAAYRNPDLIKVACARFPGRIIVGIDARGGFVAVQGWTESTAFSAIDMAKKFEGIGVKSFIFTDITRDGMKSGPNIEAIRSFARATTLPVIAAGGVSSIKDIEDLLPLQGDGVSGVIIGRALYDGSIELDMVIDMMEKRGRSL
jgi:phosphoribosylformimino-5-aminoimidazole carboxamide ribotide isomerase